MEMAEKYVTIFNIRKAFVLQFKQFLNHIMPKTSGLRNKIENASETRQMQQDEEQQIQHNLVIGSKKIEQSNGPQIIKKLLDLKLQEYKTFSAIIDKSISNQNIQLIKHLKILSLQQKEVIIYKVEKIIQYARVNHEKGSLELPIYRAFLNLLKRLQNQHRKSAALEKLLNEYLKFAANMHFKNSDKSLFQESLSSFCCFSNTYMRSCINNLRKNLSRSNSKQSQNDQYTKQQTNLKFKCKENAQQQESSLLRHEHLN